MMEFHDVEWFPFSLQDGQQLVLDVNWGADGQARAEAVRQLFDADGNLIGQAVSIDFALPGESQLAEPSVHWVGSDPDGNLDVAFQWLADGDGFVLLDGDALAAAARLGAEGAPADLFDGGGIEFGADISMGDVLIGSDGADTYRVTGDSQGETVTVMGFGDGSMLDISELLSGGDKTLDVTYDETSGNSIVKVFAPETAETVIVVHGVDLTADFDFAVITDHIV